MSTKSQDATISKQAQILALYDGVRTTREIAEIVGCDPAYVRVVARQRKGLGPSDADRRYMAGPRWDAVLERRNARRSRIMRLGDKAAGRVVAREVYLTLREAGADIESARRAAAAARQKVLRRTAYAAYQQTALEAAE